jgi:sugar lactone lactonase YvrE
MREGSRKLYSVDTNAVAKETIDDREVGASVIEQGDKGGASDGLESDAAGYIYCTDYGHNAILRRHSSDGSGEWETIAHDPRLLWADTLSLAANGYLYVTANQLHRQA